MDVDAAWGHTIVRHIERASPVRRDQASAMVSYAVIVLAACALFAVGYVCGRAL